MTAYRLIVISSMAALALLCLAWELWLAPLRPGGSLLALKALPLVLAMPSLVRGSVRSYQWWSMLVLIYITEGLMRATSERGTGAHLAWLEVALATTAFVGILMYVRALRTPAPGSGPG